MGSSEARGGALGKRVGHGGARHAATDGLRKEGQAGAGHLRLQPERLELAVFKRLTHHAIDFSEVLKVFFGVSGVWYGLQHLLPSQSRQLGATCPVLVYHLL